MKVKIVLGVDGSAWSRAAVQAVLDHHWPDGSEIRLVTVIRTLDTFIPGVEMFVDTRSGDALGDLYVEAKKQLEIMIDDLKHILTNCQFTADARVGDVAECLMTVAEEWQADLIVVGSHSKRNLAEILLGSVSQALITHAPCPVLVVKDNAQARANKPHRDFKKILIPLDDSYFSSVAMHWVAGRKWADDVEINLLHVANHDIDETPEQRHARHGDHETAAQHKAAIRQASMYALEARAKYLGNRMGVSRFSCRVEEGKASTAIVEAARKLNADLIIMGSHGHAARALRVLGSTTSEVTAKAPCSVEVVRVPHSLLPGHEGHDAPEHMDTHVQIIDKAPRRDDRPHVPPASFM